MARKSSKTAHVMNLLAGDNAESPKSDAARENLAASKTESPETIKELTVLAQQASIQTKDGALSPSPISIIDMSSSVPDPVAELIKQQLEEDELAQSEEVSLNPSESLKEQTIPPINDEQVTSEPEMTVSVNKEESQIISTPEQNVPSYQYLNVMEHVVKGMVEDYMEKFDVCACGHCVADVTALTLTHLPPKYIVVEPPAASPLLNFYSTRFSQQIIVELTKACSIVKENPHH